MIKKLTRIFIKLTLILLICQNININIANAGYLDDTITDANKFIEDGKSAVEEEAVTDDDALIDVTSKIYNILLALGIVISVIVGGILGIQLMWGTIEQQVKAKEMLLPYVVGCFVIFGAFGIWEICVTIFSQL